TRQLDIEALDCSGISLYIEVSISSIYSFFFFFFQAEDGIRDSSVTGVQTCALPISLHTPKPRSDLDGGATIRSGRSVQDRLAERSEERRVGKECRSRWWRDH